MVFGDTRLDLADQIGSDIRRLGINTTPNTRKKSDRRRTERKTGNYRDDPVNGNRIGTKLMTEQDKEASQSQNTQAYHTHSHHRTTREGDFKGFGQTCAGGMGGPHVGLGGHLHADETGQTRAKGTYHKGQTHHGG